MRRIAAVRCRLLRVAVDCNRLQRSAARPSRPGARAPLTAADLFQLFSLRRKIRILQSSSRRWLRPPPRRFKPSGRKIQHFAKSCRRPCGFKSQLVQPIRRPRLGGNLGGRLSLCHFKPRTCRAAFAGFANRAPFKFCRRGLDYPIVSFIITRESAFLSA